MYSVGGPSSIAEIEERRCGRDYRQANHRKLDGGVSEAL